MANRLSIEELSARLDAATRAQQQLVREINALRQALFELKLERPFSPQAHQTVVETPIVVPEPAVVEKIISAQPALPNMPAGSLPANPWPNFATQQAPNRQWEKFVGENLINKVGIAILIIGVAIGAKYAIDKELISPLGRILLGYLTGLALLGTGFKLFASYRPFSAVLTGGALAIFYFITFFAYDFYGLLPQALTFAMMVAFTAFGLLAGVRYKTEVIAVIGMVGAYGVPFLLSNGSGQLTVLYGYVAFINFGLLYLSFRMDWRWVYYLAFALSWLIFGAGWLQANADQSTTCFWFAQLFFLQFYGMFLGYKTRQQSPLTKGDLWLLLLNALLGYGFGYAAMNHHLPAQQWQGMYTLAHAAIHLAAAFAVKRWLQVQPAVLWLLAGIGLSFVALTIPVQLDGQWVTLLWTALAVVLSLAQGRTGQRLLGQFALALLVLSVGSWLLDFVDYDETYTSSTKHWPAFFFTNLALVAMLVVGSWQWWSQAERPANTGFAFMGWLLPGLATGLLLVAGLLQTEHLWMASFPHLQSLPTLHGAHAYQQSRLAYINLSALAYATLLWGAIFFLLKQWRTPVLVWQIWWGGQSLMLWLLLTIGLYQLSELRELMLGSTTRPFVIGQQGYLFARYALLALLATSFWWWRKAFTYANFSDLKWQPLPLLVLHLLVLWWLSSELLQWMDVLSHADSYKLALSILWGSYGLLLIGLGIYRTSKALRVAGLALFSATLLKLFLYDLSGLTTIGRTIVFVSLGVLLLVASFLYNKFKHRINPPQDEVA